jgi:hypothetical protein
MDLEEKRRENLYHRGRGEERLGEGEAGWGEFPSRDKLVGIFL